MSANDLPPGWVGTDVRHYMEIVGGFRMKVTGDGVDYHDQKYRWSLWATAAAFRLLYGDPAGFDTAALARADGLAAVETFARKMMEQAAQLRAKETA